MTGMALNSLTYMHGAGFHEQNAFLKLASKCPRVGTREVPRRLKNNNHNHKSPSTVHI